MYFLHAVSTSWFLSCKSFIWARMHGGTLFVCICSCMDQAASDVKVKNSVIGHTPPGN